MSSFTDELIRDLDQNERDAKRVGVSRLAVLKEVIQEFAGSSFTFAFFTLIVLPLLFGHSTFVLIDTTNRIPSLEEGVFQIFEARGIAVEVMHLSDPTLSNVMEEVSISFLELVGLAQQNEVVYYSREPTHKFFVVDKYRDVIHCYVNERIYSIYHNKGTNTFISPATGVLMLIVVYYGYTAYHAKYKEMAGF